MRRWCGRAFRLLERAFAVLGVFFLVYHGFFDVGPMVSHSMAPTLESAGEDPDWVLIEKRFTARTLPERFRIIAFQSDGVLVTKRVVGLPGETIQLFRGTFRVNGEKVATPVRYLAAGHLHDGKPFAIPEGHIFVLGDNARDSEDSRFIGALPLSRVGGRVLLRVWPPRRFGVL